MKHTTFCLVFALCVGTAVAEGTHTVTFRRLNGTVLLQTNAIHGANATAMAPELPSETDFTARGWDCIDKLACVTNDVTCWALYEASTAKSPSTSIASQTVVDRATPRSSRWRSPRRTDCGDPPRATLPVTSIPTGCSSSTR